jgi:hypothetical protein
MANLQPIINRKANTTRMAKTQTIEAKFYGLSNNREMFEVDNNGNVCAIESRAIEQHGGLGRRGGWRAGNEIEVEEIR